jgi:hypothetical protein
VGRVYVGDLAPRRVGDNSQACVGEEASAKGGEGRLGAERGNHTSRGCG